jgi:hypothetical protein
MITESISSEPGTAPPKKVGRPSEDKVCRSRPLVFECVSAANIDAVGHSVGPYVSGWAHAKEAEHAFASLWVMTRTNQAFLLIAHDGEHVKVVTVWRLETWADGVCFRCIAAAGNESDAEQWVPAFIDLARDKARAAGARKVIWECHGIADSMPADARLIRQTFAMEVDPNE